MFTIYSILPIYRACRDARRRVETGVSPCQKGGAEGIPIRLPIFRYALLWCAAHSVTHLMCAPSFAPSTPRLPKNILRSPTFARTRATAPSHTIHRLPGGVSRRRCPSHTTVIVRRRTTQHGDPMKIKAGQATKQNFICIGRGNELTCMRESARQLLRPYGRGGKSGLHWAKAPGNAWAARADGKCHRKYTA